MVVWPGGGCGRVAVGAGGHVAVWLCVVAVRVWWLGLAGQLAV